MNRWSLRNNRLKFEIAGALPIILEESIDEYTHMNESRTGRWCQQLTQCSKSKSSKPFKRDLVLQYIPLSKQLFKTQLQIENEDVTWSPRYNMIAIRSKKHRALSLLQEMELDGWFFILRIILETCTIQFMHKFNMSFVFSFLYSWIDVLDLNQPFNYRAYIW
jgi:hypothetical protein